MHAQHVGHHWHMVVHHEGNTPSLLFSVSAMCTAGQSHFSVEQHNKVQTPTQELRLYETDAVILIIQSDLK